MVQYCSMWFKVVQSSAMLNNVEREALNNVEQTAMPLIVLVCS